MNVVSDQSEVVKKWKPGLKVYYVNAVGLTNKNINEYLKLLLDKTTLNKKYKVTSAWKKEYYEKGGKKMSKELTKMMEEERAEGMKQGIQQGMKQGRISILLEMIKDKALTIAEAAKRYGVNEKEFLKLAKA